ncbi:hypothetical protein FE257_000379 [Aspergillus nanangensis]|uniref:Zn(2)-C6 fungal-type domain-containing protein n=1 Tax=Aspergillus nanangensis TaxID=2582783 RepID=A0AAD4CU68_ASPNN|nr:hypothetical protein FE257_000379 [Aspergillus nanangensis]
MVYRGKPSTGCQNCRSRHIKCDETRPHCRACIRTGRTCPGYPHPLDVMLRQRTAFDRKKKNGPSNKVLLPKSQESVPTENYSPSSATSNESLSPVALTQPPAPPFLGAITSMEVPGSLYFPLEDTVTSLFFNSYLYLPKDPLIRNGFMELLPQSYSNTSSGSHLHLGALAVSFFSVAAWTGNRPLLRSAEQFFAKAISKTRLALQGDVDRNIDDILMTVLLLSTYEDFSAMKDNRIPGKAHLRGAIALVNSKGAQERDSPQGRTLSSAVQTQIIKTSMGLAQPIPPPNVWPLAPSAPESASSQLMSATSELVNLRQAWHLATTKPGLFEVAEIDDILSRAVTLDSQLSVWEYILPQHWKPTPATIIPQSVRNAGLYRGRCDCYADQWIASTWNFYRDSRVVIQNIILNCLRLLPNRGSPEAIQSTLLTIETIVADMCATVPFFLGSQTVSIYLNPSNIEYPQAEGVRTTHAHKQAAPLLGGWFVMGYLNNLTSPELCLPAELLTWIGGQIHRVHRIYTLDLHEGGSLGPPSL